MSDYIIHNRTLMSAELYHYGVKGMKWGVRKKQARTEYKKALKTARALGSDEVVNAVKQKHKQNMAEIKADKKYFKTSVKALKEARGKYDDIIDSNTGLVVSRLDRSAFIQSTIKQQKGEEYCKQVLDATNKSIRNTNIAVIAGTAAFAIGSAWASSYSHDRY